MTRPTTEDTKRRTRLLVLLTVLAWGVYDLGVYLIYGGPATISTAVGEWMAAPWYGWLACAVVGGLCGHFAGMMTPDQTPHYFGRLAAVGAAVAVMYLLTRQS